MTAANELASLIHSIIKSRNAAVDKQLSEKHLHVEELVGNSNCFFIAISVALHENQLGHPELRQSVARHRNMYYRHIFALVDATQGDDEAAHLCTYNISTDNLWTAEGCYHSDC